MNRINKETSVLFNSYLVRLQKVEQSFREKDSANPELIRFWGGLVRDSTGRWLKYYFEGNKYFQYGMQPKPDLQNKNHCLLIKAAIKQQTAFINGLINKKNKNYKRWLISLHRKQIYNKNKIYIVTQGRFALIIHSSIVLNSVLPLAARYKDPYKNVGTQIVRLPMIDKEGLPRDVWGNKQRVFHYYPNPSYIHQYLAIMEKLLEEIVSGSYTSNKDILSKIALYYQYGINTHMFENINQSLFANQMNALLQVFGFEPINHGILDFVAMRLQTDSFIRYFVDEVKAAKRKRALSSQEKYFFQLSKQT